MIDNLQTSANGGFRKLRYLTGVLLIRGSYYYGSILGVLHCRMPITLMIMHPEWTCSTWLAICFSWHRASHCLDAAHPQPQAPILQPCTKPKLVIILIITMIMLIILVRTMRDFASKRVGTAFFDQRVQFLSTLRILDRFQRGEMFDKISGSPQYMAPELVGQRYDYRVDMWLGRALGLLLVRGS